MDSIKYLDFFSIKFNFYTNNQPNYQNIFGGIMTFLYVLLCIIIFLVFSYDDLNKLNPITTKNEIPYSKRKIVNMINENIWIPFRMVNYENKFVDHRGSLYIVPYLIEGKYNEKIGMDLKYHLLNYKLCNETAMIDKPFNYRIDVPLNQLFCIDRNNITFGGNWNDEYLHYIEINLYLCEEGITYNSSDPRCKKLDKLLKKENSSLLFDFYFPIVQFQPTNLDKPIEIIYKNYYYRLTTYSYKIEKLYLREHILSDDKNMIRSKYKNSSCWGMSSLYSDDYFLPHDLDPISNNSNTSRIYALNIYMDDGLVYYTRTFKKIFLIISNVFPIFRFSLYFLKKFTQHVKMSIIKRQLTGLIFEKNKIKHKKIFYKKFNNDFNRKSKSKNKITGSNKSELEIINNSIKENKEQNNIHDLNHIKNNNFTIYKNNINNNTTEKKDNNNNYIYFNYNILNNRINNFSLNDDNHNKNKKIYEKEYSLMNLKNKYEELKLSKSPKKKRIIHNNKKYIFPYYYFFLDIFFDKIYHTKKFFCINKLYFTVYNFMCQIYDISTHIIFYKQLNLLNNIFKEKMSEGNELYPFILLRKINLNDNKNIEKLNKNYKNRKSMLYSTNLL